MNFDDINLDEYFNVYRDKDGIFWDKHSGKPITEFDVIGQLKYSDVEHPPHPLRVLLGRMLDKILQ